MSSQEFYYNANAFLVESKSRFDSYGELIGNLAPDKHGIDTTNPNSHRYKNQPIEFTTTNFESYRAPIKKSLANIVEFLWNHYDLPTDLVLEYGAGAMGYFYSHLKPNYVHNWQQVEINPLAIAENKRRNPSASVIEGSYDNILYKNIPLIAGLSCLDTTDDISHTIAQIAGGLMSGGYLLHLQDVGCSNQFIVRHTKKTRVDAKKHDDRLYFINDGSIWGVLIDGKKMTINEVFQESIGDAINNNPDLELMMNHYVTAVEVIDKRLIESYFMGYIKKVENKVEPHGNGIRFATVLATIARKR